MPGVIGTDWSEWKPACQNRYCLASHLQISALALEIMKQQIQEIKNISIVGLEVAIT